MYNISDYLIKNHKPIQYDSRAKYGFTDEEFSNGEKPGTDLIKEKETSYAGSNDTHLLTKDVVKRSSDSMVVRNIGQTSRGNADLQIALKKYRMEASRSEGIKPYMVFTDKELDGLMDAKPRNRQELLEVKGFAEKKVSKYGEEILRIFDGA